MLSFEADASLEPSSATATANTRPVWLSVCLGVPLLGPRAALFRLKPMLA